jgi:AcrR family transcriptional regulator
MAVVGRPRTFDKNEALTKAMYVFWEKGYEGTTMADLIESIGIKAPSIYAAFGNKDAIFKEVVTHYLPIVVNGQLGTLNNIPNIYEAVDNTLKECVSLFSSNDNPHNCLIMTAAINTSPEHIEHVEALKNIRNDYKAAWRKRFEKAILDNQMINEANPNELAEYFTTIIQGMALRAKDGVSRDDLVKTSEIAIKILKQFVDKNIISKKPD